MYGGASGRESASPEPGALIRQASLGKKTKPTLTTVKSGDRMRKQSGDILRQDSQALPNQRRAPRATPEPIPVLEKELGETPPKASLSSELDRADILDEKAIDTGAAAIVRDAIAGKPVPKPGTEKLTGRSKSSDVLSSGTGFLDSSSSESEEPSIKTKRSKDRLASAIGKEQEQRSKGRSPLAPVNTNIAANFEPDRAFTPENEDLKPAPLGMADQRPNKKRPPRLNVDMDAVRDAEARGSMTSLPDLIRRATKLASNLDRGRTASRLGMNFFEGSESDEEKLKRIQNANRRSGSISDILASFPPPGSREEMRRSFGQFSSMLRHSQLPSDSDTGIGVKERKHGRCCGMPLWLFVLLLIVLTLLVAAAVVVPVMLLVVIPGQKDNGNVSAAELASCRKELTCKNGGTNILSNDGTCRCLCVSGYTGSTCTQFEDVGCATIDSVGGANDATVGDDIPRLLNGADNFNIPLDGEALLGLFSSSDMTCTSENALVTFNDASKRSLAHDNDRRSSNKATRTLHRRDADHASTNNGVAFQSGSPSASATTSASAASSSPASSSGGSAEATSPAAVDFASIAVLYVFQDTSELDSAANAQLNFQEYFSSGSEPNGAPIDPNNVSLGDGYFCNLIGRTLTLPNGTVLGRS